MSSRPAQPTQLQKGALIGSQCHAGFVDTFNWIQSCTDNLAGGDGCEVTGIAAGHPEIKLLLQGSGGVDVIPGGKGKPYTITLEQPFQDGMANLSVIGTDDTVAVPLSGAFQISAMSDTNLSVTCPLNEDDEPGNVIAIGVYWI